MAQLAANQTGPKSLDLVTIYFSLVCFLCGRWIDGSRGENYVVWLDKLRSRFYDGVGRRHLTASAGGAKAVDASRDGNEDSIQDFSRIIFQLEDKDEGNLVHRMNITKKK